MDLPKLVYPCRQCDEVFPEVASLLSHKKKTHEKLIIEVARKEMQQCETCGKIFSRKSSLKYHQKKVHEPGSADYVANAIKSEKHEHNYLCDKCGKTFLNNSNLKRHRIEDQCKKSKKPGVFRGVKCAICDFCSFNCRIVSDHYADHHNIDMKKTTLTFDTFEEFNAWKIGVEKKTKSHFVKSSGTKKRKSGVELRKYVCHRDGNFVSSGNNIRQAKKLGSNKINAHCPAKIELVATTEGITVHYVDKHVGHDLDLGRMNITRSERAYIAKKLAMKIPFQKILDEVHSSVTNGQFDRIHLLSRKDLWNIVNSFNLNPEPEVHEKDYVSVDAWLSRKLPTSNTIRFYKSRGEILEKYPEFKREDFLLVIMNTIQKEILTKYGNECVCIDAIHGLNACDFQLYTLMVHDDLRQGFPCVFFLSNRSDTVAMELFFKTIKDSISHTIKSKTFMSDMDDTFYNAWCSVMSPTEQRVYCGWHVNRAWKSNLYKIRGKDNQISAHKKLKSLMTETKLKVFNEACSQFFKELNENQSTKEFSKYFEMFKSNPKTWAFCYRKAPLSYGVSINSNLESVHKMLKQIYTENKKVKKIDEAVYLLMTFVRNQLFDRSTVLTKEKITNRIAEVKFRHKQALTLTDFTVLKHEDSWIVKSTKISDSYYVRRNNSDCKCQFLCSDCEACVHAYHCNCIDSSVKWNMCKHIHLVCIFLNNKITDMQVSIVDTNIENGVVIISEANGITKIEDETFKEEEKIVNGEDKDVHYEDEMVNEEEVNTHEAEMVTNEEVVFMNEGEVIIYEEVEINNEQETVVDEKEEDVLLIAYQEDEMNNMTERKSDMVAKFLHVINMIHNKEQLKACMEHIAPLEGIVEALSDKDPIAFVQ